MKLCRLCVTDFAGIAHTNVELGPGLNVLYGPNDLGKSTLADAIRVALLLPHTSNHAEQYIPWTGGNRPLVELTFQTEAQRFWRVRKQFSKSGFSLLEESRDNVTFTEVEKGRRVDARLRELLRWGIPEPGGAGGAKGLPDSFLATVLLSTQADVAAVLRQSLEEDPTGSGKERIAAALQAVAQDPLFLSLLRRTQERRDEAYTEKGAKKGSKDSPFRKAADRVRQLREEKERWQLAVDDSESVEHELRELATKRTGLEERVGVETGRLAAMERRREKPAHCALQTIRSSRRRSRSLAFSRSSGTSLQPNIRWSSSPKGEPSRKRPPGPHSKRLPRRTAGWTRHSVLSNRCPAMPPARTRSSASHWRLSCRSGESGRRC